MTRSASLASFALATLGVLLASCAGTTPGYAPLSAQRIAALTLPHYEQRPVHPDRRASWMRPGASSKDLLYIGDWGTNDVYVFSYPKLVLEGTLTGFDEPYGMCVDQKGDVYVTNFGNGKLLEYAHGGTSPINTYSTNGYSIGCSISAKGDVSVTDFYTVSGAGEVCVWKGGSGSSTCYSDGNECYYLWGFGYDRKGDLIGAGEYSGIVTCGIIAGQSKMIVLNGYNPNSPGGAAWDGKYLVLDDQEAGLQPVKLKGGGLIPVGKPIVLTDSCNSKYVDIMNPFFFGKENVTAASTKRATAVVAADLWCYNEGKPAVEVWKYPAGGMPILQITTGLTEPYGAAMSIAHQ